MIREMLDTFLERVGVKLSCILNGCISKKTPSMNGFYPLESFVRTPLYPHVFINSFF